MLMWVTTVLGGSYRGSSDSPCLRSPSWQMRGEDTALSRLKAAETPLDQRALLWLGRLNCVLQRWVGTEISLAPTSLCFTPCGLLDPLGKVQLRDPWLFAAELLHSPRSDSRSLCLSLRQLCSQPWGTLFPLPLMSSFSF